MGPTKCALQVTLDGKGETPWERLHVVELEGVEGISQLFRFTLTIYSHEEVDPEQPLGSGLTVTLRHSDELVRHVDGVVSEFSFVRTISNLKSEAAGALFVYRLTLMPSVWQLNLASACRIFRKKDVVTILGDMFKAISGPFRGRSCYVAILGTILLFFRIGGRIPEKFKGWVQASSNYRESGGRRLQKFKG